MKSKASYNIKGILFAVVAAVGFGLQPLLANIVYGYGVKPLMLAFLRVFLMIPVFFVCAKAKKEALKVPLRSMVQSAFLGLFGAVLTTAFIFYAYDMIDTSVATILNFSYPFFVLTFGALIYKDRISRRAVFSLILCIIGIICTCGVRGKLGLTGCILALASGLTYGIYILYLDKSRIINSIGFMSFSFWFFTLSSVILLPVSMISGQFSLDISVKGWLWVIIFALDGGIVATTFLQIGIREIGGTKSSIIGALEPVTSAVAGILFLNEELTILKIAGMILIIISTILVVVSDNKDSSSPPQQ